MMDLIREKAGSCMDTYLLLKTGTGSSEFPLGAPDALDDLLDQRILNQKFICVCYIDLKLPLGLLCSGKLFESTTLVIG